MRPKPTRVAAAAVTSVLALLTALIGSVVVASSASAHGSTQDPPSRVYGCRFLTPDNELCKQAWASNSQALYDWNEVNIGDAAGAHQSRIPDGQLCSAGRSKYAAFNTASDKWPVTNLKPGSDGKYSLQWLNTAPHATAYYKVYITKPGFDVNAAPLKWSDLEFVHDSGASAPASAEVIRTALPARSTHSIIYTIWQRSDSPEAFYACNDVTIGGSGTPTATASPTSASPTPTTASPTPTTASPTPTTASPTPTTTAPTGNGGVTIALTKTDEWGSGRNYDATITNTSSAASSSWKVNVPWPNNVEPWNAASSHADGQLTLSNVAWNGSLASGAGVTVGFTDRSYVPPTPTTCTAELSGVAVPCSVAGAPTASPSPTPTTASPSPTTASPTPTPTTASPTPTPTTASPTPTPTTASPTPTPTTASPTPTPTASAGTIKTVVTVTTNWGSGYCANVTVSTTSATPIAWTAKVPITKGKVSSVWEANYSVSGKTLTATGKSWNATVKSGKNATFGFCAG